MASAEFTARLERLKADFQAEKGYPFQHFFCPFLHVDEAVSLCEGHIINDELGTSNAWVPQREDFDTFYGSRAEAQFVSAVQDRSKTPMEKWIDPKRRKRHKPQLLSKGEPLEHYFTEDDKPVPGQTPLAVVSPTGEVIAKFVIKKSAADLMQLHGTDIQIAVDPPMETVPAMIAAALKAAHLTMFKLNGYRHVFSTAGQYLAGILRDFFLKYRNAKKRNLSNVLSDHFRPHTALISPTILNNKSILSGTVLDNRLLAAIGMSDEIFAIGVLIPAGPDDAFCVWLPSGQGHTINTYIGFLKEPPTSIGVKLLEFRAGDGEKEAHWTISNGEPMRLAMPNRLDRDRRRPKHESI